MLVVAHRMPASATAAAELATAGADVFGIDLQLARRAPVEESIAVAAERVPEGNRLLLNLEDDRDDTAMALARRVLEVGLDPRRTLASSKHWPSLRLLSDAGFPVWATVADRNALRWLERGVGPEAGGVEGSGLAVRHSYLTRELVAWLKRFGLVTAWTVNDLARAGRLVEWGVDGVTTDRPEVMRAVRAASTR